MKLQVILTGRSSHSFLGKRVIEDVRRRWLCSSRLLKRTARRLAGHRTPMVDNMALFILLLRYFIPAIEEDISLKRSRAGDTQRVVSSSHPKCICVRVGTKPFRRDLRNTRLFMLIKAMPGPNASKFWLILIL